jgi:hypothetical protein
MREMKTLERRSRERMREREGESIEINTYF